MMAMSARHLNRTTHFDPFVSDHYYQACLEKLIPALDDHGVTMDDDLLAATVILRLLEEFDGEQWISLHYCVNATDTDDHSPTCWVRYSGPFFWNKGFHTGSHADDYDA
jgi:hypothetical protein